MISTWKYNIFSISQQHTTVIEKRLPYPLRISQIIWKHISDSLTHVWSSSSCICSSTNTKAETKNCFSFRWTKYDLIKLHLSPSSNNCIYAVLSLNLREKHTSEKSLHLRYLWSQHRRNQSAITAGDRNNTQPSSPHALFPHRASIKLSRDLIQNYQATNSKLRNPEPANSYLFISWDPS